MALLMWEHSLANASDLVVGGASAGGLAVYLHADRWRDRLPVARVSALPDSGFFLAVDAVGGWRDDATDDAMDDASLPAPLLTQQRTGAVGPALITQPSLEPGRYATDMRSLARLANVSSGLNPACVSELGGADCFFAQNAARFLRTPTFALQSVFDSWQTKNEMAPGAEANVSAVNAYGARVSATLHAALLGAGRPNGAFVDACAHHCFKWGDISIRGDVQAAAFAAWYAGENGPRRLWQQNDSFPCASCCHAAV